MYVPKRFGKVNSMSVIKPFKGYRPEPKLAHLVAALPYDVMTSAEARIEAADKPYSFLHVDKAEIDLDPSVNIYDDSVYAKAAENLNKMIEDKVFIQDEKDVFYIYSLVMDGRCQTGLVACASIDEYLNGTIKKHELTRADKEEDRIRHVDTCDANTGPIFLTYRAKSEISSLISDYKASHAPIYDFTAEDGITHTVWLVDDDETIALLKEKFLSVPSLYIADGHHRNASAVKVGLKRRGDGDSYDKNAEFNYYLAVLFPDEELHILDYNRVLRSLNGLSSDEFLNKLSESFIVEKAPVSPYRPTAPHNFGMYLDSAWYSLTLKDGKVDESDPIKSLDVSILQAEVLEPILGIGDIRTDSNIDFVGGIRGLSELEKRVDSGEMRLAFSMYPTSISQMMDIADNNLIMPPKSTWFEPKLRSGLFIHKLS
jgi:uncharacterized protein (DUF1015 family)